MGLLCAHRPAGEVQPASVFGEVFRIGGHIQNKAQEVPGSAGKVRGLHLTPCGYSTLIIITSVMGDPESI